MKDKIFIDDYLERYKKALFYTDVSETMIAMKNLLLKTQQNGKKAIVVGNGGSAAMASHVSVDFTKQAGIRTLNFNEADLITCFANDYGYENWVAKSIEFYGDEGDLAILISSSGKSANMINAAVMANSMGIHVITLTGFKQDNPLKKLGELNFWLDSKAYNVIENTHQIWLLMVCDLIIGKSEYPAVHLESPK
jgi:D-sedoheptulose 7-phosphate isomerase